MAEDIRSGKRHISFLDHTPIIKEEVERLLKEEGAVNAFPLLAGNRKEGRA